MTDDLTQAIAALDRKIMSVALGIAQPSTSWYDKTCSIQELSKLVDMRQELAGFDDKQKYARELLIHNVQMKCKVI